MHEKSFIRLINNDLKNTCNVNEIPYNIKSQSFRINMISNLLKITTVQHVADIIFNCSKHRWQNKINFDIKNYDFGLAIRKPKVSIKSLYL